MNRILALAYGLVAYVLFLGTFLYAIGFVTGLWVPKSVDSGPGYPPATAIPVNVALLSLFALQHSIMARQWFKRWWTRMVPKPVERSTFVLFTCAVLGLLFWQWKAMPDLVWKVEGDVPANAILAVGWAGWAVVLISTFIIDHFELFGLKQVFLYAMGKPNPPPAFKVSAFYRHVRHPLMLGFLVGFWATPTMTAGHLLFAAVTTGYILVAIRIEERDLVRFHGAAYESYRRSVPMLLPIGRPGRVAGTAAMPEMSAERVPVGDR